MATIEKLERESGVVYKAVVRKKGHPKVTRTFKTRSAAERWGRKTEAEIEQGDAGLTTEAQRHTLTGAIVRYRTEVLPELRPETARKYEGHLTFWMERLGHLRLVDVNPARIAAGRDELRGAGKAPATCNRYLASLAGVLTTCVRRWHWLGASPMRGVEKLAEANGGTRFLSEPELRHLLRACRESASPDLETVVLLAITTGARHGEILGLRWRDVDLPGHVLHLRADNETTTKGGIRALPIADQVFPLLAARRGAYDESLKGMVTPLRDPGLVFPSRVARSQPISLRTPWKTALRRAGIRDFRFHDLRHSCASFLAKGGASLLEIGAVLGHRSANTTKRYAHLTEQHTHELVRGMADKILGGKS